MNQPQPDHISLADFLAWEQQQADRYEWIDGMVVRCAGGSDEHAAIISNLNALFHAATIDGPCFVRGSDRKLVPRDKDGHDLGSFYADLFVSCAPDDRRGDAARVPTLVIEVLSTHVGGDSTRRYVIRYAWSPATDGRRLLTAEYRRGPVPVPAVGLSVTFDQIYAGTNVPALIHPSQIGDEEAIEIILD